MMQVLADYGSLITRWRLWYLMAMQDVELRYRRSAIGPFWISISLAAMILGLSLLYSQLLNSGGNYTDYVAYLASGLLVWGFISGTAVDGCNTLTDGEAHLRNVPLPLSTLSGKVVFRNLIIFAHNALVVVIMLLLFRHEISSVALLAIPGLALLSCMMFFWGLVVGPLSARFRDIPQIVASIMQVALFLSPILWRTDQLTERAWIAHYNPLTHMLSLVRDPLIGRAPPVESWIVVMAITATLMLISFATLGYFRRRATLWL